MRSAAARCDKLGFALRTSLMRIGQTAVLRNCDGAPGPVPDCDGTSVDSQYSANVCQCLASVTLAVSDLAHIS